MEEFGPHGGHGGAGGEDTAAAFPLQSARSPLRTLL